MWSGLKSFFGSSTAPQPSAPSPGRDPRPYLAGALPGLWASNHLNEAARCEGWQFVAVRSLAKMCSQASLHVRETGTPAEKAKRIKEAIRWRRLLGDHKGAARWERRLDRLPAREERLKSLRLAAQRKARTDPAGARHATDVRPDLGEAHPLVRLLKRPNPEWSLATFLFAATQQLALTGSCLVWCVRDVTWAPRELYVLPTGLCTPRAPTPAFPRGSYWLRPLSTFGLQSPGDEWAEGTLGQALLTGVEIDFRDVKAVRWPHPLMLSDGLSPLSAIRLWVDVANEMDRSNFSAMINSERPGMLFEMDPTIDPDPADLARFDEFLMQDAAGSLNAGRHLRLPRGVKGERRSTAPSEMDYGTSQQRYMGMNLAAHSMTPISCGIAESGSYGAYWAAIKQTTDLAARPTLNLLAGEITELCGAEYDGPACEALLEPAAIDDPQLAISQAKLVEEQRRTDVQAGNVLTVDEYREMRGWKPLGGKLGGQFVGVRTEVEVQDADGGEPGVQTPGDEEGREGEEGDGTADDDGPGTRREDLDRPPGRQDGNGKRHLSNGRHAGGGGGGGRRW